MHSHEPAGYECPFCVFARGGETEHNKHSDIVYDDGTIMAFVSPRWWPNDPGNLLIIPHEHFENIYDIPDELFAKINQFGKKAALAMKESYGCDGISLQQHNEPAGDQVVWHFHVHVFPRWEHDDLDLNHNNSRYVSIEEREPYAEKLRKSIH